MIFSNISFGDGNGRAAFSRAFLWRLWRFLPVLLFAVACTSQLAASDTVRASGDAAALIMKARAGQRITLPAGSFGMVRIENRDWSVPVVVDARNARMRLAIRNVSNLHIVGGTFADANGDGPLGYAVGIAHSRGITIEDALFTNATRGVVIDRSQDIALKGLTLTGLRSDGVNVALSQKVSISNVRCSDFNPAPRDHPDCVQAWSRPSAPPTSDITVRDVVANGKMQGVFFGNMVRGGVDDGGFDRVSIRGSQIATSYVNGVAVFDCRNCTIADNRVEALPGTPYRALVRIERCTDCVVSGNRDEKMLRKHPTRR